MKQGREERGPMPRVSFKSDSGSPPPARPADVFPGLDDALVHRVFLAGEAKAREARPSHPPNFARWTATGEAVATLRDELAIFDYPSYYKDGINGVLHPDGRKMLMLVPGDANTGNPHRDPKSKRRGPRSCKLVEGNQLSLFPELVRPSTSAVETWFILHRYDHRVGLLQLELAQPRAYDSDKRVDTWGPRIMIEPLRLGTPEGTAPTALEFDSDERTPVVELDVAPREGALDQDDAASDGGQHDDDPSAS